MEGYVSMIKVCQVGYMLRSRSSDINGKWRTILQMLDQLDENPRRLPSILAQ